MKVIVIAAIVETALMITIVSEQRILLIGKTIMTSDELYPSAPNTHIL